MNEMENNSTYTAGAQTTAETGAQTTAETGAQTTANTASYAAQGTSYAAQNPQQYSCTQYGQQPVVYAIPQQTAGNKSSKERSTFAKVLLWICGVAAAATFLFVCTAVWILGLRAIYKPAQTQSGEGQNGYSYSGGSDGNNNGGGLPDDYDFFQDIPGFGSYGGGSSDGNSSTSKKAGLGVTVTEIQLDFTIEDKYEAGCVIVSLLDDSAFKGTQVRANDLIVEMDGVKTPTLDALTEELDRREPGDPVTVTLARYEKGVATTFTCEIRLIEIDR